MQKTNIGTWLKMWVKLECGGLTMKDFDFECKFFTFPDNGVTVRKKDMKVEDGRYIALVDTTFLTPGELRMQATAFIPDGDINVGYRTEIASKPTSVILYR